jgi:hypothetical protein
MRLTVTSVVATGSAIDELGQLGAVQIIAKLAAATVRRDSNLPAGIPDLTQNGFRAPKRVYTFQIVALEVVTLPGYELLTFVWRKPGRARLAGGRGPLAAAGSP